MELSFVSPPKSAANIGHIRRAMLDQIKGLSQPTFSLYSIVGHQLLFGSPPEEGMGATIPVLCSSATDILRHNSSDI